MSTPHQRSKKGQGNTTPFTPADGSKPKKPKAPPNPRKKRQDGFDIGTFDPSTGTKDPKKK
jgi:hypothetical protein